MGNVRRLRKRVTEPRDGIQQAWDEGLPPPPPAYLHQFHDVVLACYFFRHWEAPGLQQWEGEHHPHARAWHEALRAGRGR